jgi:transposase
LLRILLIGYLYGITSERKLVEELRMHLTIRPESSPSCMALVREDY